MIGSRLAGCVTSLFACLATFGGAWAGPTTLADLSGYRPAAVTPVVVFGKHGRQTADEFAAANHLDAAELRKAHEASGIIICGRAHGAGQLTLANNVITTAAHVFFDEKGHPRAKSCTFVQLNGKGVTATGIDLKSIVAGSTNPYALPAVNDWAVARLEKPVSGPTPYELAAAPKADTKVEFVARGHIDWGKAQRMSFQNCELHDQTNRSAEGTREFAMDCDTGDGASGGALMEHTAAGDRLAAVLVGYRSIDPEAALPFSAEHYNFVVTVEGAFREAVVAMAHPKVASATATQATPPALVASNPATR